MLALIYRLGLVFGLLSASSASSYTKFEIDSAHSTVGFEIGHMMVMTVEGKFLHYNGQGMYDLKTGKIKGISLEISAKSITTDHPDRDVHLRSPDFFDVAKYKTITFKSKDNLTKYDKKSKKPTKISGILNMHGVAKEVTLDVVSWGAIRDEWGNDILGFTAVGKIDRRNWGLTFQKGMKKAGDLFIDNMVTLKIKVAARTPKKAKK